MSSPFEALARADRERAEKARIERGRREAVAAAQALERAATAGQAQLAGLGEPESGPSVEDFDAPAGVADVSGAKSGRGRAKNEPKAKGEAKEVKEPKQPRPAAAKKAAQPAKSQPKPSPAIDPLNPLAQTLKRLGMEHPAEGLLCTPAVYDDLRYPNRVIPDIPDEDRRLYVFSYLGEARGFTRDGRYIEADPQNFAAWKQIFRLEFVMLDDERNRVTVNVFGNTWPYRELQLGEEVVMVGRLSFMGRDERAYLGDVERPPAHAVGKVWVKYLGAAKRVSGEKVEALVKAQLDNPDAYRRCAAKITGALGMQAPQALAHAGVQGMDSFEQLLKMLHEPASPRQGWFARAVAQKIAAMATQAAALRHNLRSVHPDAPVPVDPMDIGWLANTQKETLTEDQLSVAENVSAMLAKPVPMNALLSGDVGTGKTLAFLLPAVAAHRAGAKVAIMAPTSILADQLALNLVTRFGEHIRGVERVEASAKIKNHDSILVGTPGLGNAAIKAGYEPNLLICDEQHKFGAKAREVMIKPWTHVLDVSATPVPRSLASAKFGGKQILNLRQCPVQKTFHNAVGDLKDRPAYTSMIRHALERGMRAAVVYPRVKASAPKPAAQDQSPFDPTRPAAPKHADVFESAGDGADAAQASPEEEKATVISGAAALDKAFPGKVVALYSAMPDHEIAAAIEAIKSGAKPLVVASTIIEIGIDIPSISVMIVRDAHCFGISQLHQLRGRLVRNGGVGQFVMMVPELEALDPVTMSRLQAVRDNTDGYELAEMDLDLRGFGAVDGDEQSGSTDTIFRFVNLRPEDFIYKKLAVEDFVDDPDGTGGSFARRKPKAAEPSADKPAAPRMQQPRLFA